MKEVWNQLGFLTSWLLEAMRIAYPEYMGLQGNMTGLQLLCDTADWHSANLAWTTHVYFLALG